MRPGPLLALCLGLAGGAAVAQPAAAPEVTVIDGCHLWPYAQCPGADLRHANLVGKDLRGVDFTGAKLNRANLRSANHEAVRAPGAAVEVGVGEDREAQDRAAQVRARTLRVRPEVAAVDDGHLRRPRRLGHGRASRRPEKGPETQREEQPRPHFEATFRPSARGSLNTQ